MINQCSFAAKYQDAVAINIFDHSALLHLWRRDHWLPHYPILHSCTTGIFNNITFNGYIVETVCSSCSGSHHSNPSKA
ncbi:hypothetical protein CS542_10275 [Pedobacter sp. IW39]|nr:hypothetical protein CS542_10275 [Pedobacter sp. IW39]